MCVCVCVCVCVRVCVRVCVCTLHMCMSGGWVCMSVMEEACIHEFDSACTLDTQYYRLCSNTVQAKKIITILTFACFSGNGR